MTNRLAPRSSSPSKVMPSFLSFPTSARPYVAARVVEYAMARNVKSPPRTTVACVLRERVAGRGSPPRVRAVERDHARLGQPRAWVGLLDGWEDAEDCSDDAEDQVERNEELAERARLAREEPYIMSCERDGNCVHSRG